MYPIIVSDIHEFPKDEKGRFIFPPHAVYVGRAAHRFGLQASPLGNPIPCYRESERAQNIEGYGEWLADRLIGVETPQRREMARLRGRAEKGPLILVSWCPTEKPCHANVIREHLMNIKEETT